MLFTPILRLLFCRNICKFKINLGRGKQSFANMLQLNKRSCECFDRFGLAPSRAKDNKEENQLKRNNQLNFQICKDRFNHFRVISRGSETHTHQHLESVSFS